MISPFSHEMLAPAAALALWTLIVMLYMVVVRFGAFKTANIDLAKVPPGGRGQDLDSVLPKPVNWPSHNYSHLLEQPTLFYPIVILLALLGAASQLNIILAWAYVGLRVVHSVWQIKVNTIPVRASIFFISSIVLIVLAVNALRAALG
ncbi:MAPEG family protein [Sphingobium sp. DEHP117]|uniref:MAPEG family protein n=1 Tax=Sphingobium sp. DEHP117 TaxID=2993436 RepID=UPI0027D528D7|nr:MAPEG family protein [Sphingobium sp. DEHP117]MDQ4420322.1 MAPEG family protein [Sphingobium sp. DEHP117]